MSKFKLSIALLIAISPGLFGCTMAEPRFDQNYSAYGGVIQRSDDSVERVNSVLDVPAKDIESAAN